VRETRGRSAYVTLNLAWFFGLCALCFLAGMAMMTLADSRASVRSGQCGECDKTVFADEDGAVVLHARCRLVYAVKACKANGIGKGGAFDCKTIETLDEWQRSHTMDAEPDNVILFGVSPSADKDADPQ